MKYEINDLNLLGDWINIKRQELTAKGHNTTGLADDKVGVLYFSYLKRSLTQKPRNIKKSTVFTCPTELENGLDILEGKIIAGEDLTPYLSKGINRLTYQDKMLFDWGIHHLHLGEVVGSSGFIARTGPVLYARFDDDNAYFIQVLHHGHWSNKQLIETLHDNWPETLSAFRLPENRTLSTNFNDSEIGELRDINVNTLLQLNDGTVYLGLGGGVAASGDSIDSVERYLDTQWKFKELEKNINENTDKYIPNDDLPIATPLKFILIRHLNGLYYLHETNNDWYTQIVGPQ